MKQVFLTLIFLGLLAFPAKSFANSVESKTEISSVVNVETTSRNVAELSSDDDHGKSEGDHNAAPGWSVIPFILLLLMIATGPLFYEHFWHHHYPKIAVALAVMVVLYYLFVLHNTHGPIHATFEYVQFIALLTGLFVASGGIMINVDKKGTPGVNSAILLIGAVIANIIGTTGASMLLIRPFIRVNKGRIKPYHIIFFIFV
ncbi:MAG: sodium:proton antiporter, partial [Cyclobacteriaceae bacterium]|nr:sodium:proton antiporter [Cyclobacteriaceae bacterium]